MSGYEDVIKLIDAEHETYVGTASHYIPKLKTILEKEGKSKEEIKDRILADCSKYWTRETIMNALGEQYKNVKQREAGKQKGKIKEEILQITTDGRTETELTNKDLARMIRAPQDDNVEKTKKQVEEVIGVPRYQEPRQSYEEMEQEKSILVTNLERVNGRLHDMERNYENQIKELKEEIMTLKKPNPNFTPASEMIATTVNTEEQIPRKQHSEIVGHLNTKILELKDKLNEVQKYDEVIEIKNQKIALVIEATNLKSVTVDEAKSRRLN